MDTNGQHMTNGHVHHGHMGFHRGMHAPQSRYHDSGKFGRMFPLLQSAAFDRQRLSELGAGGGLMDPGSEHNLPHPDLPAGFVFLGQFIDHDITFDTTSSLERQNDPEGIQNFRTPVLELDSVYGAGPDATPYLYSDGVRLLIDAAAPRDLPRNSTSTALIGDPRNDENLLIAQLHHAFLRFHNAIVDDLEGTVDGSELFEAAQQEARWHFQWIVLHDFLPRMVGQKLVDDIYTADCTGTGRRYYTWRHEPFIPIEFAVAAYRFGHTLIPGHMKVNDEFMTGGSHEIPLFDPHEIGDSDPDDLSGGVRAPRRYVDWRNFFDTGDDLHQPARQFNHILSGPLFTLPFSPDIPSLAERNLLRGLSFSLPSGQQVACAMCIDPLTQTELEDSMGTEPYARLKDLGLHEHTPLWFYILAEGAARADGRHLGPVGGRIVAEVLIGLLEGDRRSFVRANPKWTPTYTNDDGTFTTVDMLRVAGVLPSAVPA
jgi:hypothetical protein